MNLQVARFALNPAGMMVPRAARRCKGGDGCVTHGIKWGIAEAKPGGGES